MVSGRGKLSLRKLLCVLIRLGYVVSFPCQSYAIDVLILFQPAGKNLRSFTCNSCTHLRIYMFSFSPPKQDQTKGQYFTKSVNMGDSSHGWFDTRCDNLDSIIFRTATLAKFLEKLICEETSGMEGK